MTDMTRQIQIGDQVRKKQGFKFVGEVLSIYYSEYEIYAVVRLLKNEYAEGLQHIYKLSQLEKI